MQCFLATATFCKGENSYIWSEKSWGLLQEYWISLFTLFIPFAMVEGGWKLTIKSLVINLLHWVQILIGMRGMFTSSSFACW